MPLFQQYIRKSDLLLFIVLLFNAIPAISQQAAITGILTGDVVDSSGASIANVRVKLATEGRGPDRETQSSRSGDFSFSNVPPGFYRLSFTAKDFSPKTVTGELPAGETVNLSQIALSLATVNTDVSVGENQVAVAQAEIREQEQQRLLGLIPNYFVTYNPDAAPLNVRQKFELTWKQALDPAAFVITGIIAGASQRQNRYPGFGQGAQGYAKRYGASYANYMTASVVDRVLLPTAFKQDPRYFYSGIGSARSRALYAISRSVICQGDNKKPQFCYSSVIGHFASSAITNFYYPAADRNSAAVVVENAAIGIGARAIANLVQEFIARKLTQKKP